jgi:hypothetical protein
MFTCLPKHYLSLNAVKCPSYRFLANFNFVERLREAEMIERLHLVSLAEDFDSIPVAPDTDSLSGTVSAASPSDPFLDRLGPAPSQSYRNRKRRHQRDDDRTLHGHTPTPRTITKVYDEAEPVYVDIDLKSLPHVFGAYTGKTQHLNAASKKVARTDAAQVHTVEELVAKGWEHYKWDGVCVTSDCLSKADICRTPTIFIDNQGIGFLLLCGRPADPAYLAAAQRACEKIMSVGERTTFQPQQSSHRRGEFPVLNFGVQHGLGPMAPYRLAMPLKHQEAMVEELLNDPDIQRLAAFDSGGLCGSHF